MVFISKKAVYFSFDALIAATIIFTGLLLISRIVVVQPSNVESVDFVAEDLLSVLDTIPVSAVNDSFVQSEIASGSISDPSVSVLEQIAAYWALNESSKARRLAGIIINDSFPDNFGVRLNIDPDEVFFKNSSLNNSFSPSPALVRAVRMVAGVSKNKPVSGSSSTGFLQKIRSKVNYAYAFFGGFVGQGNITVKLQELPSDVNSSMIESVLLEADINKNASVYFNGVFCTNISPSVSSFNLSSDSWNLSSCSSLLVPGVNNFSLFFNGLNDAYVGGGFLRVAYRTSSFVKNSSNGVSYYWFPSISGIVNLFDSFYVPGSLNSLSVYLHYFANHSNSSNKFYLTIGNTTVYFDDNSTSPVSVTISDSYLSSVLNYSFLSNNTVPLRLGFENLTYASEYVGMADVVIVTDVSGSMDWNFTDDYSSSVRRNCDDPLINDASSQRLSVAKCLDKDFSSSILNVSGNFVGLVSYESSTDSTLPLTTNLSAIYDEIGMGVGSPTGYVAGGGTCICCGINSAYDLLASSVSKTLLISNGSVWNYTNESLDGSVPLDVNNNSWFSISYSLESNWSSGVAVLGHDAGDGGVPVATDMGEDLNGNLLYADLWELKADNASPEVDFTSGLNSTANSYGILGAVDGWDWSGGVFDYSTSFTFLGVYSGVLLMRTPNSGSDDSSGAYAVSVNITPELYNTIVNGGSAVISFNYGWDDYRNYFEYSDEVWVKARWTSPYSGAHYLGSNLDSDHWGGDSTLEVAARDNPDVDIVNDYFSQDISDFIEGPGVYYLELGGKLLRSASNEWGYFYFDNVLLSVSNKTDYYYLRKHFTISDLSLVRRGVLNILADDVVSVYLNGNNLINNSASFNGSFWDIRGFSFPGSYFKLGDNVVAVLLKNSYSSARFDLELFGLNDSQQKNIMLMTDGQANYECSRQGWTPDLDGDGWADTASDDAIQAACDAAENLGVRVYAVGFSDSADEATLKSIADCGNGLYRKSSNTSELSVFYEDVVLDILEVSRQSQSIVVSSGTPSSSVLYPDSYILINYTPFVTPVFPNELQVDFQSSQFKNCTSNFTVFSGLRVVDSFLTSYSGDHWTSLVMLDNFTVFNLSEFNSNFSSLGDPFIVQIPAYLLTPGNHSISFFTGDDSSNTTGCSLNNSLFYSAMINTSYFYSSVLSTAVGCNWFVSFEDGSNSSFSVPESYSGNNSCFYSPGNISFNSDDAYDVAVYNILSNLDFDSDSRVFVNLGEEDLKIVVSLVNEVPYLWGPAVLEARLWQ